MPRKIKKMSSINIFQKGIAQRKTSQMFFFATKHEEVGIAGAPLVSMAVPTSLRKFLSMNEMFLFSGWFQVIFQLCVCVCVCVGGGGSLVHQGVGYWHVISCSVVISSY